MQRHLPPHGGAAEGRALFVHPGGHRRKRRLRRLPYSTVAKPPAVPAVGRTSSPLAARHACRRCRARADPAACRRGPSIRRSCLAATAWDQERRRRRSGAARRQSVRAVRAHAASVPSAAPRVQGRPSAMMRTTGRPDADCAGGRGARAAGLVGGRLSRPLDRSTTTSAPATRSGCSSARDRAGLRVLQALEAMTPARRVRCRLGGSSGGRRWWGADWALPASVPRCCRARRGRAARPLAALNAQRSKRPTRRTSASSTRRCGMRLDGGPVRAASGAAATAAVLHRAAEPQSAAHESVLPAAGVSVPRQRACRVGGRKPAGLRVEHLGEPARPSLAPAAGRLARAGRLSAGVGTRCRVHADDSAQFPADGPGDGLVARGARGRRRPPGRGSGSRRRRSRSCCSSSRTWRCDATRAPFVPLPS